MTSASSRWDDLLPRLISGCILAGVGITAVWAGGIVFHLFVAIVCALMIWELARMLGAGRLAHWPALMAAVAMMVAGEMSDGFAVPLLFLPALFRCEAMRGHRVEYSVYAALVMIAGYGLMSLRDDFGVVWIVWLIAVVISTDIGGYFAGRIFGGPKILPRISPKKTWSGTTAGWIAAVAVSIPFVLRQDAGWELLGIAVAVSMASQLGDMAESALKRRQGVKDASDLIPGHGGLFDRFDSMLGASIFLLLIEQVVDFPPAPVI